MEDHAILSERLRRSAQSCGVGKSRAEKEIIF